MECYKCTLEQMASLNYTQNYMSSHTGMWSSHKITKLHIYTKLENFLRSIVPGLTSLNLYTKHMIRIKIHQIFLKHVADRHHMGSGLTRVLISFNGCSVPWFQPQQKECLP